MVVGFKCGDTLKHSRYNQAAELLQSGDKFSGRDPTGKLSATPFTLEI